MTSGSPTGTVALGAPERTCSGDPRAELIRSRRSHRALPVQPGVRIPKATHTAATASRPPSNGEWTRPTSSPTTRTSHPGRSARRSIPLPSPPTIWFSAIDAGAALHRPVESGSGRAPMSSATDRGEGVMAPGVARTRGTRVVSNYPSGAPDECRCSRGYGQRGGAIL